jgi:hypothetical protein
MQSGSTPSHFHEHAGKLSSDRKVAHSGHCALSSLSVFDNAFGGERTRRTGLAGRTSKKSTSSDVRPRSRSTGGTPPCQLSSLACFLKLAADEVVPGPRSGASLSLSSTLTETVVVAVMRPVARSLIRMTSSSSSSSPKGSRERPLPIL